MRIFIHLILAVLLTLAPLGQASASDRFAWMDATLSELANIFNSCLEVPNFSGLELNRRLLDLEDAGQWVSTGVLVDGGKLLSFEWDTTGAVPNPKKYQVLFRMDPRFTTPQVFIQEYDYVQKKYISDFHQYMSGIMMDYQDRPEIDFENRVVDVPNYFNFVGRDKINVQSGEVVNISLEESSEFFRADAEFNSEYDPGGIHHPELIYTTTPIQNNQIISVNHVNWCSGLSLVAPTCTGAGYQNSWKFKSMLTGNLEEPAFPVPYSSMTKCPSVDPICYYKDGEGLAIFQAGNHVKPNWDKFVTSNITGKKFLYHKATSSGDLDFLSGFSPGQGIDGFDQLMSDWTGMDHATLLGMVNATLPNARMTAITLGRYTMSIEIGNGDATITTAQDQGTKVFFYIQPEGTVDIPDGSTAGTEVDRDMKINAPETGFLWLKVEKTDPNIGGTIAINTGNYKGTTWFSDLVYGDIVEPLRERFNEISALIYNKLVTNATLQRIARTALVLYIIIYGLMFLAGATKITAMDLVIRVLKIGVILLLFSETSWTFFNENLFKIFVEGSDYLFSRVAGQTSMVGNVFGFIDPIFDRYSNPRFWGLLAIQLLQIHTGLTFFAIITIYSILIFLRGAMEIIITYILAFIGLAVLISLAPFFIILLLFEKTKSMFNNWLSSLFNYMVQPTILLVFFLLIDQLIAQQLTGVVTRACWGILIPLNFALDLNHIGIPFAFNFQLPFLPGIPFWVPEIAGVTAPDELFGAIGASARSYLTVATSSLLFLVYCKLAAGLVDYVNLVVQSLTNVLAARQDGELHGTKSPVGDIMGDIGKVGAPFKKAGRSLRGFVKEKVIDQKYGDPWGGSSTPDYGKIAKSGETADKVTTEVSEESRHSWSSADKISSGHGPTIGMHRKKPGPSIGMHRKKPAGPTIGMHRKKPAGPTIGMHRKPPSGPTIGAHRRPQAGKGLVDGAKKTTLDDSGGMNEHSTRPRSASAGSADQTKRSFDPKNAGIGDRARSKTVTEKRSLVEKFGSTSSEGGFAPRKGGIGGLKKPSSKPDGGKDNS